MPGNQAAVAMLRGQDVPAARCGRPIQPVNFYEADDATAHPAYRCSGCFKPAGHSG